MKPFLVTFATLLVIASATTDKELWESFKETHGKIYTRALEEQTRYTIFSQNLRRIEEHNAKFEAGETTWKMGITQFADLTEEEFSARFIRINSSILAELGKQSSEVFSEPTEAVPASIDWRTKGAVTEVKDQGACGGCWAFAATGTLEGLHYLKSGKLQSFSEQNLLDCATDDYGDYGSNGCKGGVTQYALNYIRDYGIELETQYPYKAVQGTCQFKQSLSALKINGYVDITKKDENALKAAVGTIGPIAVGFNADGLSLYSSGIYDSSTCPTEGINHDVLFVGYGTENGVNYWIVKNSWGKSFGESGYFRMVMGKNMCNLTAQPCYAKL